MLNATKLSHSNTEAPLGITSFNDVSLVPEQAMNMSDKELDRNIEQISGCTPYFGCGCDAQQPPCPLACPQN